MDVSIMIPAHKSAFLERTLCSALEQQGPEIEIIISDDSGDEDIAAVVAPYLSDQRVTYFCHPQPAGIVANYRYALEQAHGRWGLYLDDDDLLYPGSVNTLWQAASREQGVAFVYAGYDLVNVIDDKNVRYCMPSIPRLREGRDFFWNFKKLPPTTVSVLFDRQVALQSGIFTLPVNIKSGDWEAWLRISLHGQVLYLPQSLGIHYHHTHGYSTIRSLDLDMQNTMFIERAADYAIEQNAFSAKEIVRWRQKMLIWYLTWTYANYIPTRQYHSLWRSWVAVARQDIRVGLAVLARPQVWGATLLSLVPPVYRAAQRLYRWIYFGKKSK